MNNAMTRRNFVSMSATMMALGLVGCGSSATSDSSSDGASSGESAKKKVAIILDGPANDGGWNASCYQAMLDAAEELGWESAYSESVEQANWATTMENYLDQGFDLLFMPGNEFTDVSKQVGADYPDAHICLLNSEVSASNIVGLVPDTKQIGLLAGALAGILSKTGHIGFIGGVELDTTKNKLDYYTKAAQKVNPDIQVFSAYANSFMDAGKGKEIAASMLTTNSVDVMFGDASGIDTGARETMSAYEDVFDIGQPGDLGGADDPLIANYVFNDNKTMLKQAMKDVEDGVFGDKVIYGNLDNGGVSVGTFSKIVTADQQKQYLEYVDQIKDGSFL